jgi:hypothetical protein
VTSLFPQTKVSRRSSQASMCISAINKVVCRNTYSAHLLTPKSCTRTTTVLAPCYFSDNGNYVFYAGGAGARVNALTAGGGIGEQVHKMFYIPEQDIPVVDKTRSAVVGVLRPATMSLTNYYPSFMVPTDLMSTRATKDLCRICKPHL